MKKHISESEIEKYLLDGPGGLNHDRRLHIEGCKSCRLMLEQTTGIHTMLKKLRPLPVSQNLFPDVESRIISVPAKSIKQRDWITYISLLLLAVISISLLFSGQSLSIFKNDDSGIYQLNKNIEKNIDEFSALREHFSDMVFGEPIKNYFVGGSFLIFLFSIIVLVFYIFFDRYYIQNFTRQ